MCITSETQKQQKTGNWHCGNLLIGYFWKMHKSATKCNETICKWCKNKHGASKIIDTLEMYHPLCLIFRLRLVSGKIGTLAFVSSNSENISCVAFLKHKNSINRDWHYGISLIG
jgi:hypothetical protein